MNLLICMRFFLNWIVSIFNFMTIKKRMTQPFIEKYLPTQLAELSIHISIQLDSPALLLIEFTWSLFSSTRFVRPTTQLRPITTTLLPTTQRNLQKITVITRLIVTLSVTDQRSHQHLRTKYLTMTYWHATNNLLLTHNRLNEITGVGMFWLFDLQRGLTRSTVEDHLL